MFSPTVISKLDYYVYILQDPRNLEVFYVGKGRGNRVFDHVSSAVESSEKTEKLDRIRSIMLSGTEVGHYILRHGLSESVAFEIEAALIDFVGMEYLSNIMGGHYSSDYGIKSPTELMAMYEGDPLVTDQPILLLNVNRYYRRDITEAELYEVTRKYWILGNRRFKVRYAIAIYNGLTREVYEVRKWFCTKQKGKSRWGFKGRLAKKEIRRALLHKSIKTHFKPGASNPVKYLNC